MAVKARTVYNSGSAWIFWRNTKGLSHMTDVKDYPTQEATALPQTHPHCGDGIVEQNENTQELQPKIWFDSTFAPLSLDEPDKIALMQAIYTALHERRPLSSNGLTKNILSDSSPRIVFLSISNGLVKAQVALGSGLGYSNAINQAMNKLALLFKEHFKPIWIKLDIVTKSTTHEQFDITKPLVFERSLSGIAFSKNTDIAFLPEQLTTYTIANKNNILKKRNINRYISENPLLHNQFEAIKKLEKTIIYVFQSDSLFFDGNIITPLYRGHRKSGNLSKESLLHAVDIAADYLIRSIDFNGKFSYSYFPKADKEDPKYNILRHAGTIYSMLEVYEIKRDTGILKAIQRGIRFLINQMHEIIVNGESTLVVVENNEIKLGGNGLATLALAKYIQLTQEKRYLSILQKLGLWIVNTQDNQGKFTIHKQSYDGVVDLNFKSDYYPGEALFALSRLYQLDPNPRWLKAAVNGALYLINVRDKGLPDEKLNHDHWLLYALNEIYRLEQHDEILAHARKITNVIVKNQRTQSPYLDWIGSYYKTPRSTPVATRMEGLCASYQLIRDFGTTNETQAIFNAIKLGVHFQLLTQFHPESTMYLPNPQRALGGFHCTLTNFEIRIDYVQHNISSILGLYKISR